MIFYTKQLQDDLNKQEKVGKIPKKRGRPPKKSAAHPDPKAAGSFKRTMKLRSEITSPSPKRRRTENKVEVDSLIKENGEFF